MRTYDSWVTASPLLSDDMIGLTVEEVDIFQYVDCPFVINVQLTDLVTNQVKLGEILPTVKVLLAYEGNASTEQRCLEHHPHLIEVIHNVGIQANGKAQIWVKLKGLSMNHDNQRFVIYLEAYRPQGERTIICAITNPFTAVRYKLIISEANSSPYVWYKDEGAKDKVGHPCSLFYSIWHMMISPLSVYQGLDQVS